MNDHSHEAIAAYPDDYSILRVRLGAWDISQLRAAFDAGGEAKLASLLSGSPVDREAIMLTLHKQGAFCGNCDYENAIYDDRSDGIEWRCEDCERCLGGYADALAPLFAQVAAQQREADARIAESMDDNEPDGYYGQACHEVAAAIRSTDSTPQPDLDPEPWVHVISDTRYSDNPRGGRKFDPRPEFEQDRAKYSTPPEEGQK